MPGRRRCCCSPAGCSWRGRGLWHKGASAAAESVGRPPLPAASVTPSPPSLALPLSLTLCVRGPCAFLSAFAVRARVCGSCRQRAAAAAERQLRRKRANPALSSSCRPPPQLGGQRRWRRGHGRHLHLRHLGSPSAGSLSIPEPTSKADVNRFQGFHCRIAIARGVHSFPNIAPPVFKVNWSQLDKWNCMRDRANRIDKVCAALRMLLGV